MSNPIKTPWLRKVTAARPAARAYRPQVLIESPVTGAWHRIIPTLLPTPQPVVSAPVGLRPIASRPRTPEGKVLVVDALQLRRLAKFAAVGVSGLAVNLLALVILLAVPFDSLAVGGEVISAVISTQVAIAWNFLLTERWVFRRGKQGRALRLLPFWALSCAALLAQLPIAGVLQASVGNSYVIATAAAIGILMVGRFLVCDHWLYRRRATHRCAATAPDAS